MTDIQVEIINIVSDLASLDTKASQANIQKLSMYAPRSVRSTLRALEKTGHLTSDDNGRYAITEKSYSE